MFRKLVSAVAFGVVAGYVSVAFAANVTMVQKDKKFAESEITVKKGDTVVFKNEDDITHNVFSRTPGMTFDLKTQQAGQSSDVKFDQVGKAEVRCAIHPQMKLIVNVE
jgi:plastocyanin